MAAETRLLPADDAGVLVVNGMSGLAWPLRSLASRFSSSLARCSASAAAWRDAATACSRFCLRSRCASRNLLGATPPPRAAAPLPAVSRGAAGAVDAAEAATLVAAVLAVVVPAEAAGAVPLLAKGRRTEGTLPGEKADAAAGWAMEGGPTPLVTLTGAA